MGKTKEPTRSRRFQARLWILATLSLFLGIALVPAWATAQTCVEPPPGSLGWWPGDGDGTDLESGAEAMLVNGAGFAPGHVDQAFSLDGLGGGQDDHVLLSRMAADGLADLTLELWVNTTKSRGAIVSAANGNDRGGNELLLIQNTTGLVVWVKQQSSGPLPVFVDDGAWHHVALVREGAVGRLYVDGGLIDVRTYPAGPLEVGPRGLLLGQDQDCLGGCFEGEQALDGLVDEVTIYARALSESEIRAVFEAGSAGKCKPPAEAPQEDDRLAQRVEALELQVDELIDQVGALELQVENLSRPGMLESQWGREQRDSRRHDRNDRRRHRRR
jgi:hypothetical protein